MINYTHVKAKVDIYNQRGDIACFAGDIYPIVGIDTHLRLYTITVETDHGYKQEMTLAPYDPDFWFINADVVERIDNSSLISSYTSFDVVDDSLLVEEVVEEIIEETYYDDGDDW